MAVTANANYPGCASATWVASNGFSWRYRILPYMDQASVYNMIDFNNTSLVGCNGGLPTTSTTYTAQGTYIAAFVCPSDFQPVVTGNQRGTNYSCAPRARGDVGHNFTGVVADGGVITREGSPIASITDGTSNTVMVGEVFRAKQYYHTSGGNPCTTTGTQTALNGQRCKDWLEDTGYCQCNAGVSVDATLTATTSNPWKYVSVRRINDKNPDCVTWPDTVSGGTTGPRPMSSAHVGGVQVGFADGSVNFVSESVDFIAWAHAFSKGGNEQNVISF